jgi:hypothetical protein
MKKIELRSIIREELERYKGGLYQAKVGDMLWIGITGMEGKDRSKVTKILPDGKVVDSEGNTYNPDGRLYKSNNLRWQKKTNPGKVVSAKIATQSDLDKEYKNIKIDFLRKFDWQKLDIESIEKIIDSIPNYSQGSKLGNSRFK